MLHSQKFTAAFADADTEPSTLTEGTYLQLRRDIIEGRLPPGEKLRVEHLKDRYGVGAGTLREALSLLLSDALVVSEGQRGFRVAPMSMSDLEDITRTRVLVEGEALRQSIIAGNDDWEAGLVAAFHKLSKSEEKLGERETGAVREWEARNREYHEALIAGCDSRWLRYLIGLLYRQSERYRHLVISHRNVERDVHAEHSAIYEAALARDVKRAQAALEVHIHLTYDAIRKLLPALE
ncbi:FCD domain-containing protein [Noviherbaspirillum denitrificans]|uniref:Transcriptional regulator n=1 Tax=Noviherbaspirillum denitrificans TaxID=1968433 RepID=A0A254TCZ7_9BURK|nr:FCD domain-containing protein [Noviherbaspirillum denitrificans]OWW20511.1 transcriptional regulator [Noviherbaspirillum denitrificans]